MKKNNASLLDVALVAAATAVATTAAVLAADKALKSDKGQAAVATVKTKATAAKDTVKTKATAAKDTVKSKAGAVKEKVKGKLHKDECVCEETADEAVEDASEADETIAE